MDEKETELTNTLLSLGVPKGHIKPALSNLKTTSSGIQSLLVHRRLPDKGWKNNDIIHFLSILSLLDTNTSDKWVGVGEREGRVICDLVSLRSYGFGHGIGRSGDLTESQPKAVGSSTMYRLTVQLTLDAIRRGSGLLSPASDFGLITPLCTGMSMSLVLSCLREKKKSSNTDGNSKCVLWCRIDQKSCFKSILTAGLRVVVIPTIIKDDSVVTDIEALKEALQKEHDHVVAIISTTSCFAPRIPDPVDVIAKIAKEANVAHVINHAYGLQCVKTNKKVTRACVVGRVDAIICSTDKNFLVPVGGAIVLSPDQTIIQQVSKIYAGRASSAPILDLFLTLLSLGLKGYKSLLQNRVELCQIFKDKLQEIATKYNERVLICPENTISYALTLDHILGSEQNQHDNVANKDASYIGSMLFTRCVSGTRVVARFEKKKLSNIEFQGFGSSTNDFQYNYLTAACAIGLEKDEMEEFFNRLEKVFKEFLKKQKKK